VRRQPLLIVQVFEQRYRIGSNIDRDSFCVPVSLLSPSSTPLGTWRKVAVLLVIPAAIHGAIPGVQQQPPDFIGIAGGDGDGVGEGDGEG
jgi:hypothetical protein